MSLDPRPFRNALLSTIPQTELDQLRGELQPVSFVMEQCLHEAGNLIEDVYFPEFGLISLTADTQDDGLVEVGVTGREGLVGTSVLLNPDAIAIHKAFVQIPGAGFRLRAATMRQLMDELPVLHDRCLRYVQFVMVQTAQSAACNARHELPRRLARWLSTSRDRVDTDELPITQEFLSYMLGVRRAGVSVVVGALAAKNVIRQSRGMLTVIDRAQLAREACSCYQIIEDSRQVILG